MSDAAAITQLELALAIQKRAFLKSQCPPVDELKTHVRKIAKMVVANKDAIRQAMIEDFGWHPIALTDMIEVYGVAHRAEYVLSQMEKWTGVEGRDIDPNMYGGGKCEVRYQPKGVIGNIVRMSLLFLK